MYVRTDRSGREALRVDHVHIMYNYKDPYNYEDGYYKTCINGQVWMIYRVYILCFYMRQLELTDPHQNYTSQIVFF